MLISGTESPFFLVGEKEEMDANDWLVKFSISYRRQQGINGHNQHMLSPIPQASEEVVPEPPQRTKGGPDWNLTEGPWTSHLTTGKQILPAWDLPWQELPPQHKDKEDEHAKY